MGIIQHYATLVTFLAYPDEDYAKITRKIKDLKAKIKEKNFDSSIILGPHVGCNGHATYVFAPSGSTLGWDLHHEMEAFKEEFLNIFQKSDIYASIINLKFGGDFAGIEAAYEGGDFYTKVESWEA